MANLLSRPLTPTCRRHPHHHHPLLLYLYSHPSSNVYQRFIFPSQLCSYLYCSNLLFHFGYEDFKHFSNHLEFFPSSVQTSQNKEWMMQEILRLHQLLVLQLVTHVFFFCLQDEPTSRPLSPTFLLQLFFFFHQHHVTLFLYLRHPQ